MREIKFRAWDAEKKIMIKVTQLHLPFWIIGYIPDGKNYDFYEDDLGEYLLRKFQLMQYTGIKDKNEKEIYEADIVTFMESEEEFIGIIRFGKYSDDEMYSTKNHLGYWIEYKDKFGESYQSLVDYHNICEIIGNIHENPELLQEK